jgi:acyl dehydratase
VSSTDREATSGTITDEGVERLRSRVGVPEPWTRRPHYLRPNTDAFRIVAEAYGDDNPLWCDPEYATASVWGAPLAPPPLVGGDSLVGEDEVTAVPDDKNDLMKGDPLRGVHAFYSAAAREWWAPLRPDHRVWRRNAMVAVLDKQSEFAERAVHEWSANVFRDGDGTVLSGQYRLMIRTERKKAREKKKYDAIEPAHWTEEQIAELDAEYAAYARRGPEPRFWEDVDEGDVVGPMVKGPMLVTDMVCWHVGMGMGLYDVKPLALGVANRQRIPRFFKLDDQGIPDVQQRVHWDPEWARRAGNPTTYDYGRMRETWLIHLCTDWMGDDAWLWKLECSFRGFNYVGDVHHLTGTVTRKYLADGDRPAVDLDLQAVNQRGTITTPGTATILLPSRDHGPVVLPDPPGADLESSLRAISEAFSVR